MGPLPPEGAQCPPPVVRAALPLLGIAAPLEGLCPVLSFSCNLQTLDADLRVKTGWGWGRKPRSLWRSPPSESLRAFRSGLACPRTLCKGEKGPAAFGNPQCATRWFPCNFLSQETAPSLKELHT